MNPHETHHKTKHQVKHAIFRSIKSPSPTKQRCRLCNRGPLRMDELRYAKTLKMEVSLRLSREDRVLGNRNRVMGGSYHMLGGLFSRASFEGIFFSPTSMFFLVILTCLQWIGTWKKWSFPFLKRRVSGTNDD